MKEINKDMRNKELIEELISLWENSVKETHSFLSVKEIEDITGNSYKCIHVVGGGCQDRFLNRLTAVYTKKDIYAGPIEATAIGNIAAQMLKTKEFDDLIQARKIIAHSFEVMKVNNDEFSFEN